MLKSEERSTNARDTAVEGNLLPPFFADLDRDVDQALFFVGAKIGVLIFVDRIEVAELVQARDGIFKVLLIVNVALIDQHFAPQHVVAREGVTGEFQPSQRELFAFIDGDDKVRNPFVRLRRAVLKSRIDFGGVLDEALRSVGLLQILKQAFAQRFAVRDFTFLQTDEGLDYVFRKN